MSKQKTIKTIITGTSLSILVFCTISFITVLTQINPLHHYKTDEAYHFNIGFPFRYYEEFWLSGSTIPNSGWTPTNLFYDCVLTWIAITGTCFLIQRRKSTSKI